MQFVNKAEHYIEVKNLLKLYSAHLEDKTSAFGEKKSVELYEKIFNNNIIALRSVFEKVAVWFIIRSAI